MTMGGNVDSAKSVLVDQAVALPSDDIAIVGFSFKLPQGVEDDDDAFWNVLQERKNLMTEWPESRLNAGSFVGSNNKNVNKVWLSPRTNNQSSQQGRSHSLKLTELC